MAVIPGHISDEVVVIGNHRDGASDINTKTVILIESMGIGRW